jgi:hypothetical protein
LPPNFTLQIDAAGDVTEGERDALRREVEARSLPLVVEALRERGYDPAIVETAGVQQEVSALAQGFVYHANIVAAGAREGGTFDPNLLARVAPGSDAVLYLNGSAVTVSAGRRAEQVTAGVFLAVVIAAVVVLIVLAARGASGGPHVGGSGPPVPVRGIRPPLPIGCFPVVSLDYTPIWWSAEFSADVPPPRASRDFFSGGQLRLFATLVDTPTGRVLWHVDRAIDSEATSPGQLRDELIAAFETLPGRISAPH